MRIGAIDCGTNSIRLLIADAVVETDENGKETTRLKDVVRQMRIVRLGQGVAATSGLPHTHRAGTSTTSRTLRPSWADSTRTSCSVGTRV